MLTDPMHEVHYWRRKATEADSEVRSLREQLARANAGLRLAGAGIITPDEDEVAKQLAAQLVSARAEVEELRGKYAEMRARWQRRDLSATVLEEDNESLRHMLNVACTDLDASRAEVEALREEREDLRAIHRQITVQNDQLRQERDAVRAEVEKLRALLQEASDDWIPHYAVLSAAIIDALRGRGNAEETNEVRPVEARDATDEP